MVTAFRAKKLLDSAAKAQHSIHEKINKVNSMNTLVSNLKKTSEESRKSRGSEEKRYFHISANKVLTQLQTMIEGSKSSIKIMTDQGGLGLLSECKEQLVGVIRRNLDVKLIIPSSQICSEAYRTIPDGVEIKTSDIAQNCFASWANMTPRLFFVRIKLYEVIFRLRKQSL